ncbi:MAG TPA: hypothetical protein VN600_02475 [Gemmatimonadaceae bacterium]|nr:hypothetical protein [Gemmatimonadaceae bacterium]
MSYPLKGSALSGHRILLILIPRDKPRDVYFAAGVAEVRSDSITVAPHDVERIRIDTSPDALSGFDPEMLPRLLSGPAMKHLGDLGTLVEACVPLFVYVPPPGCLRISDCLFGLGQSADGRPLLFQGMDYPSGYQLEGERPE